MTKVLLTGGSGFVAGHIIDVLLQRGHSIVTTVRSQQKLQTIKSVYNEIPPEKLEIIVISDIAVSGAFKDLAAYGVEAVIHVASPFHFNVTDPKKDLIDPAVQGTLGVLHAVKKFCPLVKRVVITSSFAAILDGTIAAAGEEKTYSEADWSPLTLEDAIDVVTAYATSKVLAEKAAWNFVNTESPGFTLSTMNPPMIYGPVKYPPKTPESINTSNQLLMELLTGKHKQELPPTWLPLWVDVRDVALAHVKAIELEEAAGKRFLLTAGQYSNARMAEIVWDRFAEFRDKLPEKGQSRDMPNSNLISFGYDNSRAMEVLRMTWIPFDQTIVDSVRSLSGCL